MKSKKQLALTLFVNLFAILVITGCKHKEATTGFISFSDFKENVSKAQYKDYAGKDGNKVYDEKSFEEMKNYILGFYEGINVKNSFSDAEGEYIDCIPFEQQPALKNVADKNIKPPSMPEAPQHIKEDSGYVDMELTKGEKDKYGNEMFCAEGFVPIKRLQLNEMVQYTNLKAFFTRMPYPDCSASQHRKDKDGITDLYYRHDYAEVTVNNLGAGATFNIWNPDPSPAYRSVSQMWIIGLNGSAVDQTVECGWKTYAGKNPQVFIYATADNYTSMIVENYQSKYFVQYAAATYLGMPLGTSRISTYGNTPQKIFSMFWRKDTQGNWWCFYKSGKNGLYITLGYIKKEFFGTGALSKNANMVQYGGEILAIGQSRFGKMGSGHHASEGFTKSAYQRSIFYIDMSDKFGTSSWRFPLLAPNTNDPCLPCYDINIFGNGDRPFQFEYKDPNNQWRTDWGSGFYFGGPGCNQ